MLRLIGLRALLIIPLVPTPVSILSITTTADTRTLTTKAITINAEESLALKHEFELALRDLPTGVRIIHLDVPNLLAMSSRGFESLLSLHHACAEREIALSLSIITPEFQRLLGRMGFLRLLKVDKA